MHAQAMLSAHPDVRGPVDDTLIQCIEQCYDCAQTCTSCADACLAEPRVAELIQCIRYNLDCADLCRTTGEVATRRTGSNQPAIRALLQACAEACRLCGEECRRHGADMEHCRICAEACVRCEAACRDALRSLGGRLQ